MILLRQVSRYVYDVFAGTGWPCSEAVPGASNATWQRVKKHHWGVTSVAGEPLTRPQAKTLLEAIERNPRGDVDPITV